MTAMTDYELLQRARTLDRLLEGKSDEERRAWLVLLGWDGNSSPIPTTESIEQHLTRQDNQLSDISRRTGHNFAYDFLANLSGNAAYDILLRGAKGIFRLF